jgi:ribosomal protein S3AE
MKGKEWYFIVAPKMFKGKVIGETLVTDPSEAMKRSIIVNFSFLDAHPSKYYIKIKFKADKVEDGKIKMKYVGHECQRDYISQMVRKRAVRIDNRIIVETKDKRKMIIKTIGISLRKTKTSVKSELGKRISALIMERVKDMKFEDVVKSILFDELQKTTRKEVSKLYPIVRFEVRKLEVL